MSARSNLMLSLVALSLIGGCAQKDGLGRKEASVANNEHAAITPNPPMTQPGNQAVTFPVADSMEQASDESPAEEQMPIQADVPILEIETVPIKAGSFQMGSLESNLYRKPDETRHEVILTKDFIANRTRPATRLS